MQVQCNGVRLWCAGAEDAPESSQAQPLLPAALQEVYLRLKAQEVTLHEEQMERLARHSGPDVADHVPWHALDKERLKPMYLPQELLLF